jgi:type IV pilus assembly protein PilV
MISAWQHWNENSGTAMKEQRGFSLLESMVAAAILAVALLSLAALQALALGKNVDASEVTRVTNLATDMLERIQSNRQRAMDYNGIDTKVACTQAASTQAMALGDCTQWQTMITGSVLPNAQGLVSIVRVDPDPTTTTITMNRMRAQVTINWTGAVDSDVYTRRSKSVTFTSLIAPE